MRQSSSWSLARLPGTVAVRDSKDPDGAALAFAPDEWLAFTDGIKAGNFDLS
jgi:uncharacterized protein DUF397